MQKELLNRRKECLKYALRGINTSEWVRKLADKYDVAKDTIYTDWRKRKEWIPEVYECADVIDPAKDMLVEKKQAREEAWKIYHNATTDQLSSKIGALKIIDRSVNDHIEMLQSLGKIHKEAEKLEVKSDMDVSVDELRDIYKDYIEED